VWIGVSSNPTLSGTAAGYSPFAADTPPAASIVTSVGIM
jgi:hypothetical protein